MKLLKQGLCLAQIEPLNTLKLIISRPFQLSPTAMIFRFLKATQYCDIYLAQGPSPTTSTLKIQRKQLKLTNISIGTI
jgi:hypothetical protein